MNNADSLGLIAVLSDHCHHSSRRRIAAGQKQGFCRVVGWQNRQNANHRNVRCAIGGIVGEQVKPKKNQLNTLAYQLLSTLL